MHRLPCGLGCMLRGKRVFLRAHGPDLGPITHRPSKYHLLVFPQPAGEPQEYLCNWYTFFFFFNEEPVSDCFPDEYTTPQTLNIHCQHSACLQACQHPAPNPRNEASRRGCRWGGCATCTLSALPSCPQQKQRAAMFRCFLRHPHGRDI